MAAITKYLEEEELDLLQGLRENGDTTINRALTYPKPDPCGPLCSSPAVLTNQVATRLFGCPEEGHVNEKRKLQSQHGGSGLHVDAGDPDSTCGSLTVLVYICFENNGDQNTSQNRQNFQYSDLAVFQTKTGGRAAVIEVMQPGFVTLVFHHPSRHLHGSVFPDGERPQPLVPGCEGMKIVCYQVCMFCICMIYLDLHLLVLSLALIYLFIYLFYSSRSIQSKQILKLAEHCHANQDTFDHYVQEHNEFRKQSQRKDWKNNALCHFAPLARVLQEYLAEMDAKHKKGEQISQHEKKRAHDLSSLLCSISCDLDDLRKFEQFSWSNTFVRTIPR